MSRLKFCWSFWTNVFVNNVRNLLRKMLKLNSTWREGFLVGIFFPEVTTRLFVIPGLRTKSYRTFTKRFSTIVKISVFVSRDMFFGKKTMFHQYRILSQNFLALLQKIQDGFRNCILRVQGKILRKTIYCFEKQEKFLDIFFGFSS